MLIRWSDSNARDGFQIRLGYDRAFRWHEREQSRSGAICGARSREQGSLRGTMTMLPVRTPLGIATEGSIANSCPSGPLLPLALLGPHTDPARAWSSPNDHGTVADQRLRNTDPCDEGRSNPHAQAPVGGARRRTGARLESGARCLPSRHRSAARRGPAPWATRPLFARAADPVRRSRRGRCRDPRRVAGTFNPLQIERAARSGAWAREGRVAALGEEHALQDGVGPRSASGSRGPEGQLLAMLPSHRDA